MNTGSLTNIVYLSQANYEDLVANGSITKGQDTLVYDSSALYLVDDNLSYVRYDVSNQGLTTTQKSNARTNLGLGTASTSSTTSNVTQNNTSLLTSGGAFTALQNLIEDMGSSEPTANNTSGIMKIVVLDHEPQTKYTGYIYIVAIPSV